LWLDGQAYGEAARSIYYGPSEEVILADIQRGLEYIRQVDGPISVTDLEGLSLLKINSVPQAALTTALLHYISVRDYIYPWKILKLEKPPQIITSFTAGIDELNKMIAEIANSKFYNIKIKMGFEGDEEMIPALGKINNKIFRVDANGGWDLDKAQRMIQKLDRIGVEIIEQPTKQEYVKEWKYIKGRAKASIIIDEGLNNITDYESCADYVDGINIKMSKSGGAIEGKRLALRAKKDKLKVMLGCMLESSIGISAAVYISSLADYFDLDGPLLLSEDPASGLKYDIDKIIVDDDIIGGPKLKNEYLK
jgi:L-alanine-DL-glutamate epimerase-like enolase superfamily enzyme